MLDLSQSIKLAQIEPGDPKDMLRSVAIKGAERFLEILPPGIAAALELAGDVGQALQGLQNGDISGWLSLLQEVQSRWIDYIGKQWEIVEYCRDTIRVDAADRSPIAAWSKVPISLACGVGKERLAGRLYWRPYGIGPRVENWAHDLPSKANGHPQTWVPDNRQWREDGYVFCPAVYPYCVADDHPETWGEGVAAVMGVRYQELLMDGADQDVLDDLFYRLMALINHGKVNRDGVPSDQWKPVQVVQEIPANPDPGLVYATPRGELWAVSDAVRINTSWNAPDYLFMTASVGQLRTMLGSLGGLMVRERLSAGATPPKGQPGIPGNTWQIQGGEKGGGGKGPQGPQGEKGSKVPSSSGGAALLIGGLAAGALYLRSKKGRR